MTKRILIVGGGTGGTMLANRLSRLLRGEDAEIMVISDTSKHWYQPGYLYLAVGKMVKERIVRDEKLLLDRNVRLIVDNVKNIDVDNRQIETERTGPYEYDYLAVATGSHPKPELIPGFRRGAHHIYTAEAAEKLHGEIQRFKRGVVVVGIGGLTFKCPVAPYEIAFLMDEYFRLRGVRENIEMKFVSPLPRAYGPEKVSKVIEEHFEERGIELFTFFNVESIDPDDKVVKSLEGEEIKYDLLVLTPPHTGAQVVIDSELGDSEGWIPTDRHYLYIRDYDDAFAIGDATNLSTPKSGAVAHSQSIVLANNIAGDVKGNIPPARFNGDTFCFIEVGFGKATVVTFNYESQPPRMPATWRWHLLKEIMNQTYWDLLRLSF